ncbi:glycosyltransferase family 4 protein [uncultured Aquabacterium sp.]|jgi:glycosyltransferase involved in cell wall biosynthesis|uniref:glycosyltransferase family 4 protein n=1 Tax=uncultured Aquabacterium sp. TaxID=158753 RepID=UPI00260807E5|nr:glycosyltransferase family 4 protein [uncultured Aquabacterium sp.]
MSNAPTVPHATDAGAPAAAVGPLRILMTLPYLPWPITSGGKARQFHLIRELASRGHKLTLLVQSKTEADAATEAALGPLVERLVVLPRRALRHPRTLWHAAVSPLPLLTTVNAFAPELTCRFASLLDEGGWDVVQIEHSYGFEPFEAELARRAQPFVLTEHNVESELGAATYGKWPAALRLLARYDQARARRWERHVLSRADAIVAVTESDARTLQALGGRPAYVVPNGVDTRAFSEVWPNVHSRHVLFLGNYEYAPNIDAVEWALTHIWPRVWQRMPEAHFTVCGHGLPAGWRSRFPDPRVHFHGYVARLADVQSASAAFLAPLRFGGGSKLKVLEAMAAGLPLVSTREGLSGLGARDGVHARVGDTADALADALVRTLSDPAAARAMGESARAHVREHFDWSQAAARLEAVYARLSPAGVMPVARPCPA